MDGQLAPGLTLDSQPSQQVPLQVQLMHLGDNAKAPSFLSTFREEGESGGKAFCSLSSFEAWVNCFTALSLRCPICKVGQVTCVGKVNLSLDPETILFSSHVWIKYMDLDLDSVP